MTIKHRSNLARRAALLWSAFAAVLLTVVPVSATHAKPPSPAAGNTKKALQAATYHVADLVAHGASWQQGLGDPELEHLRPIDALVRVLLKAMDHPERLGAEDKDDSLQVDDGTKLEIRASVEEHNKIVELLRALRISAHVAVVMESWLLEIDASTYSKEVQPKLPNEQMTLAIEPAWFEQLRRQATLVRQNSALIQNSRGSDFFSQLRVFAFIGKPADEKRVATGLVGFAFKARPAVSKDRRSLRLELTRDTSELAEVEHETAVDPKTGREVAIDVPNIRKSSRTATLNIEDQQLLLLPVRDRPRSTKSKDRVLFLVVKPTIHIREEERERAR